MKNAKNTIAVNANNEVLTGKEAEAAISKAKKGAKAANTEAPATIEAEAPMSKAERRARAAAARRESQAKLDANKPGELIDGSTESLNDRVIAKAEAENGVIDVTNEPAVAIPQEGAQTEKKGKEKAALTPITEVKVGSVVTYGTSNKPYLITEGDEKGRFMFSLTQQFNSTKNDFGVTVIVAGDGSLPESLDSEKEYSAKDRKYTLNDLLAEGKKHLAGRQAAAAAKAKKAAPVAAGTDEAEEGEGEEA